MTFLPSAGLLATYTLAVVLLTYTPGPDMAFFVGKSITGGRLAGLAAFFGVETGLLFHSALVALGLSAVLAASATAFGLLKIAGALYLLYLAIEALRHGSALRLQRAGVERETLRATYLKGLAINVLNPKIILFFMTFLPQFVEPGDPHAAGKLMFLGLWFSLVAIPLTLPMIFGSDRLADFLKRRPSALRALDFGLAGIMSAFAVRLLTTRS